MPIGISNASIIYFFLRGGGEGVIVGAGKNISIDKNVSCTKVIYLRVFQTPTHYAKVLLYFETLQLII